ncbi:hypothetical protein OAA93_02815 [Candidatus Pelagibacter ubique]|nr:hypothetical protein [Candidatus Pelagibacter ubique]
MHINDTILNLFKKYFLNILILLILFIYLPHVIKSFINFPYHFNLSELLINYQGGFIRRGVLGEIILKSYQVFKIDPLMLLSSIFSILFLIKIFILFKLLKKYKDNYFLLTFILLGPVIILFSVYDIGAYLLKDKFINVLVLTHVFFVCDFIKKKKSIITYNYFLIFFLVPFLNLNLLMHQNQFLFLGVHILISCYTYQSLSDKSFFKSKYIYSYLTVFISLFLVSIDSPSILLQKISLIKISLLENFPFIYEKFPMEREFLSFRELVGNFNLKIGGVMKMTVFFTYAMAANLFIAFILSVGLIFMVFHYRLSMVLNNFSKKLNFNYWFLLLPCLLVPFVTTDFGRAFNMISIHLLAFYLIFPKNPNIKTTSIFSVNKILTNYLFCIFLFFYCFFWTMPHAVGWQPMINSITAYPDATPHKNTNLMVELVNLSKHTYNVIDKYIITLPKADFMK